MQSPGGITYHHASALGAPRSRRRSRASTPRRSSSGRRARGRRAPPRRGSPRRRSAPCSRRSAAACWGGCGSDDVAVAGAQCPRALDEGALAQGQHLGADDPPGPRPRGQPDDQDQHPERRVEQPREARSSAAASGSPGTSSRARRGCGRSSRRSSRSASPTAAPSTAEMIAAAKPTTIETRAPARSCESTSEPLSVVPEPVLGSSAAPARRGSTRRGRTGAISFAEHRHEARRGRAP